MPLSRKKAEQEKDLEMEITRLESETLEERNQRKEEDDRKKEDARKRKEAPKARGKYMTFDDRMEDLKRFKETHGHANVTIREDKSLDQFCNKMRLTRKNPGNGKQLTNERIAALIGRHRESGTGRPERFDDLAS